MVAHGYTLLVLPQIRERYIIMIAAYNAIGIGFEHHRIVMYISLSTATRETTVQTTTEFATVYNHTTDHRHHRTISHHNNDRCRESYINLHSHVPDLQAF